MKEFNKRFNKYFNNYEEYLKYLASAKLLIRNNGDAKLSDKQEYAYSYFLNNKKQ